MSSRTLTPLGGTFTRGVAPSERREPGASWTTFTELEEELSWTVCGAGFLFARQQSSTSMRRLTTTAAETARVAPRAKEPGPNAKNLVAGACISSWRTADTGISLGGTATGWEFRYRLSKRPKRKLF